MASAEANSEPDPKWIGLFFYRRLAGAPALGRWSRPNGLYFLPAMVFFGRVSVRSRAGTSAVSQL
jgi:hypothetical protein